MILKNHIRSQFVAVEEMFYSTNISGDKEFFEKIPGHHS